MKPLPKFLLLLLVCGGIGYGVNWMITSGAIPQRAHAPSVVPPRAELPNVVTQPRPLPVPQAQPREAAAPSRQQGGVTGTPIRMEIWAWNAHSGLILANGGAETQPGSMMARRGVRLTITRQDDVPQMQNDLMAFAQALAAGDPQPSVGTTFVTIMGDGSAAFLAGLNPQLRRLGPDYVAQIVGSFGYSVGEDKFMGLPAWKRDPQAARGALVAGVLRDGDWNIVLKWAADNGIPNNPDETTWDPEAINWVAADTYIDAAQKYVAGYCEERPVKGTGERRKVCVDGVTTWTPGDVQVARGRGGLVSIVSTKEYRWQMPNVVIGIRKWMRDNRAAVEGMLLAGFEGAELFKSDEAQQRKAAELSAAVYREEDGDYWFKYFRGVTERDRQGLEVELGGSAVNGLPENAQLFGLESGGTDIMGAVYRVFGDIVVAQYPSVVAEYPAPAEAIETAFIANLLQQAQAQHVQLPEPERPMFVRSAPVKQVVSRRDWQIQFDTGKATFRPEAEQTLRELRDQLTVAGGLAIEIHGHTDNTGSPVGNMRLSEQRAFAVRDWLRAAAPTAFPQDRVRVVPHGQNDPEAGNDTEAGRAKNRRVEVVLGVTS